MLIDLCEHVFGREFAHKLDLSAKSELWKNVAYDYYYDDITDY